MHPNYYPLIVLNIHSSVPPFPNIWRKCLFGTFFFFPEQSCLAAGAQARPSLMHVYHTSGLSLEGTLEVIKCLSYRWGNWDSESSRHLTKSQSFYLLKNRWEVEKGDLNHYYIELFRVYHSFSLDFLLHSCHKYLLRTSCVLGTAGDRAVNKQTKHYTRSWSSHSRDSIWLKFLILFSIQRLLF